MTVLAAGFVVLADSEWVFADVIKTIPLASVTNLAIAARDTSHQSPGSSGSWHNMPISNLAAMRRTIYSIIMRIRNNANSATTYQIQILKLPKSNPDANSDAMCQSQILPRYVTPLY